MLCVIVYVRVHRFCGWVGKRFDPRRHPGPALPNAVLRVLLPNLSFSLFRFMADRSALAWPSALDQQDLRTGHCASSTHISSSDRSARMLSIPHCGLSSIWETDAWAWTFGQTRTKNAITFCSCSGGVKHGGQAHKREWVWGGVEIFDFMTSKWQVRLCLTEAEWQVCRVVNHGGCSTQSTAKNCPSPNAAI